MLLLLSSFILLSGLLTTAAVTTVNVGRCNPDDPIYKPVCDYRSVSEGSRRERPLSTPSPWEDHARYPPIAFPRITCQRCGGCHDDVCVCRPEGLTCCMTITLAVQKACIAYSMAKVVGPRIVSHKSRHDHGAMQGYTVNRGNAMTEGVHAYLIAPWDAVTVERLVLAPIARMTTKVLFLAMCAAAAAYTAIVKRETVRRDLPMQTWKYIGLQR
eukprot:scaffold18324_cov176-Amphora_coffeaeformis.AAC.10